MLPPYDVKKFPSYLNGLVNDLARLRGDEARLRALLAQLDGELARVRVDAQACERLIGRYDSRLCTAAVAPVRAWRRRYGPIGALQDALVDELRNAFPGELPTSLLAMSMMGPVRARLRHDDAAQPVGSQHADAGAEAADGCRPD